MEHVAASYQETLVDEGHIPVRLVLEFDSDNEPFLEPDSPGIRKPLTVTIGRSEEDIWRQWA